MFPGRRGAGRIFYNQVRLSGRVPQVCCLFGPSAAGGAYIPAFCDVVFMVDGNASMYLGSPRMAEEVIGEKVTLEEMGGARMHTSVSGCGDNLVADDAAAIELARTYLSYLPTNFRQQPPSYAWEPPTVPLVDGVIPLDDKAGYDVHRVVDGIVDADSFFELKPAFAPELVTGFGALEGNPVGILANNPMAKGGVLFTDSADKAARFIWLCRHVQRAADLPRRRSRLHDRFAGRARGHHPPRGEDDLRRRRGDRPQDLRRVAQVLRRRAVRDVRPRSSPTRRSACQPPRSR